MTNTLDARLDGIFAARDRSDMGPTIDALLPVYAEHPDNPRVLYELGGAYDTAGDEATALGFYERAMERGLEGDIRRRCYLQYGSTLRNLGRTDESLEVFSRARAEFPESVALGAFEALTFHAAGRENTALASLLELLADHVDAPELGRYKPALRGNAEYLRSLDADASRSGASIRLQNVTYAVTDVDAAMRFFVSGLGFEVRQDETFDGGWRRVVVGPPEGGTGFVLALAGVDEVARRAAGDIAFFLETDDFVAAQERLVAAGARFRETPRHETYGTVAVFEDPAGIPWDLIEPPAPTS